MRKMLYRLQAAVHASCPQCWMKAGFSDHWMLVACALSPGPCLLLGIVRSLGSVRFPRCYTTLRGLLPSGDICPLSTAQLQQTLAPQEGNFRRALPGTHPGLCPRTVLHSTGTWHNCHAHLTTCQLGIPRWHTHPLLHKLLSALTYSSKSQSGISRIVPTSQQEHALLLFLHHHNQNPLICRRFCTNTSGQDVATFSAPPAFNGIVRPCRFATHHT
jgi:hypothetical protein